MITTFKSYGAILLFFATTVSAQTVKVLDSAKRVPLGFATVIVVDARQGIVLQEGITDASGDYIVAKQKTATRYVAINAAGYKKVHLLLGSVDTTVFLAPDIRTLQGVIVQARKLPLKIIGNKMEYDISQVPNADYLNTAEIIDRLPFLQIEDNQLKMMNESITVLIDGKNNPIYSTVEGLRSLPPQAIQKVEVTLAPTARGNGGKLLNITLKKDYFLGFNGNVDVSGSVLGGATRASLTYWHKKYGFDASFNYSQMQQKIRTDAYILNRTQDMSVSSQNQAKNNDYSGNAFVSGFYNLDSLSTLDLEISLGPSKNVRSETANNIISDQAGLTSGNSIYHSHNTNFTSGLSLNYTKKGKKEGNAFYLLTNISHSGPQQQYTFRNLLPTQNLLSDQDFISDGSNDEKTIEMILQRNVAKRIKYTIGSKLIYRNNNDNYDISSIGTDSLTAFKMNQLVSSTYTDADFSFKKLTFHTALRLDYNHNDFLRPSVFVQEAWNFVPNLSLSYNINRSNLLMLTYSRSLIRPGSNQFAPAEIISSAYERDAGNQHLNNEVTSNWGLNYMGNFSFARLGINLRYASISGLLREISTIDSENVVVSTPVNVDLYHSYTIGFFADFQLFKKVRVAHNSSGSYLYEKFAGRSISQWSGYLTERIYYQINKKSMVGFNLTRYSPNLLPQGKEQSLAYTRLDFNYSYYFNINKNLPTSFTISLTNPDLWRGYRSYTEINSPELYYREERLRKNGIVGIDFRISLRGKQYGNRTFNKEKSIQNSDLHTDN